MDNQNQDDKPLDAKTQEIINQLKQYSTAGLSFEEAKQKLVSQGNTDEAIDLATDNYDYGSKQVSDIPTQVTQYFDKHPDQAAQDATELLKAKDKEQAADDRRQAVTDLIAGDVGPDLQSRIAYQNNYAHDVGLSFWQLIGLGLAVNGIAYLIVRLLHASNWFYLVNGALALALTVILIKRIK